MANKNKLPNFFIVGAPKCGTTSLYHYLDQHPQIFMSYPKEVNFFCTDLHKESDKFHGKRIYFPCRTKKDYNKIFSKIKNEKIAGDSSVYYMYSKTASKNIHNFNPDSKIIIVVRNPLDFIYSWYSDNVYVQYEDSRTLIEALNKENIRKKDWSKIPKNTTMPSRLYYSEISKFSEQINRYIKLFGKKNIKLILFDDFKNDTKKLYNETVNFLEVSQFNPEFKVHNANKVVKFNTFDKILKNKRLRNTIKKILPFKFISNLGAFLSKLNTLQIKRKSIDSNLEKKLKKQLLPEVKKLSKLLDRDLVKLWGYDKL